MNSLLNLQTALNKTAFVTSLDTDGCILEANEKFLHALATKSEKIIGHPLAELLSADLPRLQKEEVLSTILKGSAWKGQLLFTVEAMRPMWVEASIQPSRDEADLLTGFIFIGFDVTEQKSVEKALYDNKLFLGKLMASAPVGLFLANTDGNCELINKKWSDITGLNLRTAAGDGWIKAIHVDDREKVAAAWKQLLEQGTDFQLEYRYCNTNGVEVPVLASAAVTYDSDTREKRILRIEQDLSEQRKNHQIIDAQKAQILATAKLTSLGEMASSIAHEINNPLAAILGSAEFLKTTLESEAPDMDRLNRMADTIINTTVRIAKIIKSLRMVSRDGDNDSFEFKDLATIFADTAEMCTASARDQQTQLRLPQLSPDLRIDCKSTQLSQTLLALVKNSLWAVRGLKEKWVELEVKELGDKVEIWITDSGNGIALADRAKIFQPFYTTKPVGKGTGLGLSVAKGVIENHSGTIWLDDNCPNTRFIISLPKHKKFQMIDKVFSQENQ